MTEVIYEGIEDISKKKYLPLEVYTLTLKHEYVYSDGKHHLVDEPIFVKQVISPEYVHRTSVVVNEMIERMRRFLMQKVMEKYDDR